MPDVTFVVKDISDAENAAQLERALGRLEAVRLVNVDSEKGLVAVSYEGGESEQARISDVIKRAGHDLEPTPGAEAAGG